MKIEYLIYKIVLLTSIAISFINCRVLLFHIAGTVNIHAIESGLKASEHRSVSSSKIKYLRCRKASVNIRVAGRDALLAAIIWVSFEITWKQFDFKMTIWIGVCVHILFTGCLNIHLLLYCTKTFWIYQSKTTFVLLLDACHESNRGPPFQMNGNWNPVTATKRLVFFGHQLSCHFHLKYRNESIKI